MPVQVREAVQSDYPIVADLMEQTLDAFYGGDHRAHAERIFSAHITGGIDHVGHFSFEQKMFVATVNGKFAGLLHIVGKRQGTYKISPLIVVRAFQGKFGLGGRLLEFAETYARRFEARQLYCTVAEQNFGAVQFFERKGFIRAGISDSHYKVGVREYMLYKVLEPIELVHEREAPNVSVVAFEEKYAAQARELILGSALPKDFSGVDESWVEALFSGYRRRETSDVNQVQAHISGG